MGMCRLLPVLASAGIAAAIILVGHPRATEAATGDYVTLCDDNARTCTEPDNSTNYEGDYVGHDEPALLFYSDTPGAGNSNSYLLRLPKDPPLLPRQDGSGGSFNFQLHVAFWFGMAMCDSQSAPNPGMDCPPDSDANIFDSPDPNAADYIGKHPGTAFMEMQFYPPGWVLWPNGISCDPRRWCAALNIDSLSQNMNTGASLNAACQSAVGLEYVNFAFITKNGKPHAPPDPVDATLATYTPDPAKDLFMNSGDLIRVDMFDTKNGLRVVLHDLTSDESGEMTASAENGFGQVEFAPTGSDCNNIPYDFHPMYSTSSEHTRVPWAAHSYNIAFSDEIGHFEYCDKVRGGKCKKAGEGDTKLDADDRSCFPASDSSRIMISGCTDSDVDFDGPPYGLNWPGTLRDEAADKRRNPAPVLVSSPLFTPSGKNGKFVNYDRAGFETDLPRIEQATDPRCNRKTGKDCVNPPADATFYPFYTTRRTLEGCMWQLGGAHIPGTDQKFGGDSAMEFGALLALVYPDVGDVASAHFNDFRRILSDNPCPSPAEPRVAG